VLSQFSSHELNDVGSLDDVVCMFNLLNLLIMYKPLFVCKALSINNIVATNCLLVSLLVNPHETSLVL
jgi:hypothetical protein